MRLLEDEVSAPAYCAFAVVREGIYFMPVGGDDGKTSIQFLSSDSGNSTRPLARKLSPE
jgi:hypothetical protein